MPRNLNLDPFVTALQTNIDISDASGSGIFSICGMALRLRDLNKWENGLKPWEENTSSEIIDWIDRKEQLWETLHDKKFVRLPLMGKLYDPFDTAAINTVLSSFNLFYGAGYAHALKPTFFLARIKTIEKVKGDSLLILEQELARDLLTIPAFCQDNAIIIRKDAAGYFLWDQMAYLKKSGHRFLNFALKKCNLPDSSVESRKSYFYDILSVQEQTYIHHELGEMKDAVFDHKFFQEIVSIFPHTSVELLARTIKDLLADTGPSGSLQHMITCKNAAGLGLYAAFQDGLFLPMFPQLRTGFEKFASTTDWEDIEKIRQAGFKTAAQYAHDLMNMVVIAKTKENPKALEARIHEKLILPLT